MDVVLLKQQHHILKRPIIDGNGSAIDLGLNSKRRNNQNQLALESHCIEAKEVPPELT